MIQNFNDLFLILFQSTILFLVLFFIFRKYIFSILDPLFYFLITQAFSILLGFIVLKEQIYLIQVILCEICFAIGFCLTAPKKREFKNIYSPNAFKFSNDDQNFIEVFFHLSFFIVVLFNIILICQKGVALFAEDPSEAKVTSFSGGGILSLVRRINWGLTYFVGFLAMCLYIIENKKKYILQFIVVIGFQSIGGSKGAILYCIQAISFFALITSINKTEQFKQLKRFAYYLIPVAVSLSLYILFAVTKKLEDSVYALGIRFLCFGDSMLYYYDHFSVKYFQHYNFIDFLNVELNSILGFFRLANYSIPLGYQLVMFQNNTSTLPIFGPMVPFYTKGHIFFGFFGSLIYTLLLGFFVGFIRKKLITEFKKSFNAISCIIYIFLNLFVFGILFDSSLFFCVIFDTFFHSFLISIVAYIIIFPKMLNAKQFV